MGAVKEEAIRRDERIDAFREACEPSGEGEAVDEVVVLATTEKAVYLTNGNDRFWVPKSQIDPESELMSVVDDGEKPFNAGNPLPLIVTPWFAKKELT